jgi:hypothetical protein
VKQAQGDGNAEIEMSLRLRKLYRPLIRVSFIGSEDGNVLLFHIEDDHETPAR